MLILRFGAVVTEKVGSELASRTVLFRLFAALQTHSTAPARLSGLALPASTNSRMNPIETMLPTRRAKHGIWNTDLVGRSEVMGGEWSMIHDQIYDDPNAAIASGLRELDEMPQDSISRIDTVIADVVPVITTGGGEKTAAGTSNSRSDL